VSNMIPEMDPRITHVIHGICVVIEQLPTPMAKQLWIVIQHLLHLEEHANFPLYLLRLFLFVNVVLWGEFSRVCSGIREYTPGSTGVAEQYGGLVGVWLDC
jgi:hypothetical protein